VVQPDSACRSIIRVEEEFRTPVTYDLTCDTCDFDRTVEAERDAYADAKEHESAHPDHFVFIYSEE